MMHVQTIPTSGNPRINLRANADLLFSILVEGIERIFQKGINPMKIVKYGILLKPCFRMVAQICRGCGFPRPIHPFRLP